MHFLRTKHVENFNHHNFIVISMTKNKCNFSYISYIIHLRFCVCVNILPWASRVTLLCSTEHFSVEVPNCFIFVDNFKKYKMDKGDPGIKDSMINSNQRRKPSNAGRPKRCFLRVRTYIFYHYYKDINGLNLNVCRMQNILGNIDR